MNCKALGIVMNFLSSDTFVRNDIEYMCQEKMEEEDSIALKIAQGLENYIKKSKEKLIQRPVTVLTT